MIDNTGFLKKVVNSDIDLRKVATDMKHSSISKEDNVKLFLSQKHITNQNIFFEEIKQYEAMLANTNRKTFKDE